MSSRVKKWLVGLSVLEVVVLGLTIHSTVSYHRTSSTSPTVLPIGPVLGWIVSVVLLVLLALIVKETRD